MWELYLYFQLQIVRVVYKGNYPNVIQKFFDVADALGFNAFEPERDMHVQPDSRYWIGQDNYLFIHKITPNPDPADFVELDDN